MTSEEQAAAVAVADRMRLAGLVFGAMATQTVGTAARLGVAELIGDGEGEPATLAAATGTDREAMARLLRTLARLGVLTQTRPDGYALTGVGRLLCAGQPNSMLNSVLSFTDPSMLDAWRELDTAVRTGSTTFEQVHGTDFFSYLAARPELSARFNASMSQGALPVAQAIAATYDFSGAHTVADIGGGAGTLLAELLRAHPHLRGILYDSAEGAAQSGDVLRAAGVDERCTVHTGDFFASVPPGADVYLMKSIIHDWDDERCATILRHCRAQLPEHGRVLIVEPVLPDVVDPALPEIMYLSDLNMLVNVGGKERTRAEFAELCATAGLTLNAVHSLGPLGFCVLEATAA